MLAFMSELEKHLIPTDQWDNPEVPEEARTLAKSEARTGVPTGIAKHPERGWLVLQTAGQGPCVIWEGPERTIAKAPTRGG